MLVLLLAASLVLGSSLLAAASYREGALLAPNTPARKAAVAIAFSTGLAVLSLAFLKSPASAPAGEPVAVVMPAASAEPAPTPQAMSYRPKVIPAAVAAKAPANSCAHLTGVESLQCLRCSEASGLRWIVCQERVRLAYCEAGEADAASCPSAIPASPPV